MEIIGRWSWTHGDGQSHDEDSHDDGQGHDEDGGYEGL